MSVNSSNRELESKKGNRSSGEKKLDKNIHSIINLEAVTNYQSLIHMNSYPESQRALYFQTNIISCF